MENDNQLYQEKIMAHYRNSPYRGELEKPTFVTDRAVTSCGDYVVFSGIIEGDVVMVLKFTGEGSIVGMAFASMLCECAQGKPVAVILAMTPDAIPDLLGMPLGPTRLQTMAFVLESLQRGVRGDGGSQGVGTCAV